MPADLLTQLERAGELLDRLALPLTIDEIVAASDRPPLGPTHDTQPVIPVEADGNAFTRRSASSLTWLRIAAATLLVAGGVVALLLREPDDSDEAGTTATTPVTNSTTATSEELPLDPRSTEDWPPDAFPAGAVLRLSETLGPYGHVWVYDIPSDGSVCVVRKTTDGYVGCSLIDAETYRTGRAWALEGDPQSSSAVLWGLAPVDIPITVTAGDATASSGPSGIWYLAYPAGVSDFTIVTPTATYTPSVTLQPLPTTTSPSDSSAPSARSPLPTIAPTEIGAAAVWSIGADQSWAPDTQAFTALVSRLGCNSGVTGEVYAPTVLIGDADITVTFTVQPTSGGRCQGNDQVPIVVDVGQPIGDRRLVDGACLPEGEAVLTSFCSDGGVRN